MPMHSKFVGVFNDDLTADLWMSLSVKEFLKSVSIWRSYRQKYSILFFLLTHNIYEEDQALYGWPRFRHDEPMFVHVIWLILKLLHYVNNAGWFDSQSAVCWYWQCLSAVTSSSLSAPCKAVAHLWQGVSQWFAGLNFCGVRFFMCGEADVSVMDVVVVILWSIFRPDNFFTTRHENP